MGPQESVAARVAHANRLEPLAERLRVNNGLANLDDNRLHRFHERTAFGGLLGLPTSAPREQRQEPHKDSSGIAEFTCSKPPKQDLPEFGLLGFLDAREDGLENVFFLGVHVFVS